MEKTIKLQDFAKACGKTDRQIQKHLKKHESELEGHFERKGPNGTWLDDYACDFIRGLMKQAPVVLYENGDGLRELAMELDEVRQENRELNKELRQVYQEKSALESWKTENAFLIAGAEQIRLALAESEKKNKEQAEEFATRIAQVSSEKSEERLARIEAEARVKELEAELAKPIRFVDWLKGRRKGE